MLVQCFYSMTLLLLCNFCGITILRQREIIESFQVKGGNTEYSLKICVLNPKPAEFLKYNNFLKLSLSIINF